MADYSTNAIIARMDAELDRVVEVYLREHPECESRGAAINAWLKENEPAMSTNCISPEMSDAANILIKRWGW